MKQKLLVLLFAVVLVVSVLSSFVSVVRADFSYNGVWIEHLDTDFLNLNQQLIVNSMVSASVGVVFVQVGNWQQVSGDVSIAYWYSSSDFTSIINSIHTYSGNSIKVCAWVIWASPSQLVNLGDSGQRAGAVSEAVSCVVTYGFDGFNDDMYEGFTGSDSDYIVFINSLASSLHGNSKLCSCDLFAGYATDVETLYGGVTNCDYVCPMLYDSEAWGETDLTACLSEVLTYSSCPVMAGLALVGDYSLTTQLSWFSSSSVYGVAVFSLVYMESGDWSALASWSGASPTPTPSVSPSPSPSSAPSGVDDGSLYGSLGLLFLVAVVAALGKKV